MAKYTDEQISGLLSRVGALLADAIVTNDNETAIVEDSFFALQQYYEGLRPIGLPPTITGLVINPEMARSMFIGLWQAFDNSEIQADNRRMFEADESAVLENLLDVIEATHRDWNIVGHTFKVGERVEIVSNIRLPEIVLIDPNNSAPITIEERVGDDSYILRQTVDTTTSYIEGSIREKYLKRYKTPSLPPIYGIDRHQRE